jgi:hypothetical protein
VLPLEERRQIIYERLEATLLEQELADTIKRHKLLDIIQRLEKTTIAIASRDGSRETIEEAKKLRAELKAMAERVARGG